VDGGTLDDNDPGGAHDVGGEAMSNHLMDILTWAAVACAVVSVTAVIVLGRKHARETRRFEFDHPLFDADHIHIQRDGTYVEVHAEGTKWPDTWARVKVKDIPVNKEVLVHVWGSVNLLMILNEYQIGEFGGLIMWRATDKQTMERKYRIEV
jgi:hypothetical protein